MKSGFIVIFLIAGIGVFAEFALAKDITAAAATAQAQFAQIGIAAAGIGITIGGILFAVGLGSVGRWVLQSGLTGGAIIFGLQGIISLMRLIF